MTQEEAQKELYSYLTPEDGAMIPIGYLDNLINKIYKDFEEDYIEGMDERYKLGYCQGYSDKEVKMKPAYTLKDLK